VNAHEKLTNKHQKHKYRRCRESEGEWTCAGTAGADVHAEEDRAERDGVRGGGGGGGHFEEGGGRGAKVWQGQEWGCIGPPSSFARHFSFFSLYPLLSLFVDLDVKA
jgi:hypothetical protein